MLKRLWKKLMSYLAMNEPSETHVKLGSMIVSDLGDVTIKYETGVKHGGIIVDTPGDPGGKSYGAFQLSLNAGTLKKYLRTSKASGNFEGLVPGSREFDQMWLDVDKAAGLDFLEDQRQFILTHFFKPAATFATSQGFSMELRSLQEAIFSISVQHGGYKSIIKMARRILSGSNPKDQIKALYTARNQYVQGLHTLPKHIKVAIYNRYKAEQADILSVYDAFDS